MRHVELGHVLQICAAACNRKERRCAGASVGLSEPPTKCQGVSCSAFLFTKCLCFVKDSKQARG